MNRNKLLILSIALLCFSVFIFYKIASNPSSTSSHISSYDGTVSITTLNRNTEAMELLNDIIPRFDLGQSYTYKNLEIITIKGEFKNKKNYVTLEEALDKQYVELKETSNVSELILNNNSDKYIYLQSGDIVKGGKQDRTLQYDLIVKPKSRNNPVSSFCVESGRWGNRDDGADTYAFEMSKKVLSSKDLKLSAKKNKNQSRVWDKVSEQQEKLNSNVSRVYDRDISVTNNMSSSSLQLTLENEEMLELVKEYQAALEKIEKDGIVGIAYAINGTIYGAEIYNNKLFHQVYEKQIESYATEAISELDSSKNMKKIDENDWIKFISRIENPNKADVENLNSETKYFTEETSNLIRFTTYDTSEDKWLHVSILDSSEDIASEVESREMR
ncbi:MAG: hypothetical protein KJP21_04440 [Bacteroidia bacterium]|nr:hypothetical protein [Bacteroidia bacterium]NNJ56085.1 hypothetical protein [Bacteroidia bacterium]